MDKESKLTFHGATSDRVYEGDNNTSSGCCYLHTPSPLLGLWGSSFSESLSGDSQDLFLNDFVAAWDKVIPVVVALHADPVVGAVPLEGVDLPMSDWVPCREHTQFSTKLFIHFTFYWST